MSFLSYFEMLCSITYLNYRIFEFLLEFTLQLMSSLSSSIPVTSLQVTQDPRFLFQVHPSSSSIHFVFLGLLGE